MRSWFEEIKPWRINHIINPDKLFQSLIALTVKNLYLISNLNFSGFGFQPLDLVMPLRAQLENAKASDTISICQCLNTETSVADSHEVFGRIWITSSNLSVFRTDLEAKEKWWMKLGFHNQWFLRKLGNTKIWLEHLEWILILSEFTLFSTEMLLNSASKDGIEGFIAAQEPSVPWSPEPCGTHTGNVREPGTWCGWKQ